MLLEFSRDIHGAAGANSALTQNLDEPDGAPAFTSQPGVGVSFAHPSAKF
jgi:hypothetical protein